MNILFIGDIVGKSGVNKVSGILKGLKTKLKVDYCIANGENCADDGKGMSLHAANILTNNGVDLFTTGNHVWGNKDIHTLISKGVNIIRPANYIRQEKGKGYTIFKVAGKEVCVINLLGRAFMNDSESPFKEVKNIISKISKRIKIIIVDFHAETTSEKAALGWYLDGKVSAVIGTHTHVQTADERILPSGTGFITDAGMTGPVNSIIGIEKEIIIDRFVHDKKDKFKVATGISQFNGVLLKINRDTGKTINIKRLYF